MAPKKKGRLHKTEEDFIRRHAGTRSFEYIAKELNRKVSTVKDYCIEHKLVPEPTDEEKELNRKLTLILHNKPYWQSIVNTLFEDEIAEFEKNWIAMIKQFGEDVLHGEELNLKTWLMLDIQATRTLKAQKGHMDQLQILETMLEEEYGRPEEEQDPSRILNLIEQISNTKAALNQYSNNHSKLQAEIRQITSLIKAAREDKRNIKVDKDTYWGYIEMLQDEKMREQEAKTAELLKISQEKAKERMSEYHVFCNNTVDRVLLNSDTVMLDEE